MFKIAAILTSAAMLCTGTLLAAAPEASAACMEPAQPAQQCTVQRHAYIRICGDWREIPLRVVDEDREADYAAACGAMEAAGDPQGCAAAAELFERLGEYADWQERAERCRAKAEQLRQEAERLAREEAERKAAAKAKERSRRKAKAKKAGDFSIFAPYLEKLVAGRRRQAEQIAPGRDPYETLLDQYERGLTIEKCDAFFTTVRAAIVPLLEAVKSRGTPVRTDFLDQDWPIAGQRTLAQKIMKLWGLDPDRCTLAESEHPFTDGFNTRDVRITTHYMPRDVLSSLYSVAHEGGHALYELHVDPALDYTVLAGGASMGLHESQSRLFENMVGRSKGCIRLLWPTLRTLFGPQLSGVTEEEFYRAANRAEPGLIRTEADELTYCLHILVRYELEKALLHGELTVADLPAAWNARYKQYLGLDVPDDARGVLQDIHWAWGNFGYFPSYALGSAYAAQAMADLEKTIDFDAMYAEGDLRPLKDALTDRLWHYGGLKETGWLVESLCGGPFDPKYYVEYLTKKYTELYSL